MEFMVRSGDRIKTLESDWFYKIRNYCLSNRSNSILSEVSALEKEMSLLRARQMCLMREGSNLQELTNEVELSYVNRRNDLVNDYFETCKENDRKRTHVEESN